MRCWFGYLSAARFRLSADGPADATASRNPIICCLIQIQTGFTFLVPVYPGCPGKEAVKRGVVVVVVQMNRGSRQCMLDCSAVVRKWPAVVHLRSNKMSKNAFCRVFMLQTFSRANAARMPRKSAANSALNRP